MNDTQSKELQKHSNRESLLDIDAVAERLNISVHTVRTLVWKRKIKFIKIGARVLFKSQDVEDFIQANLVPSWEEPEGTL